MSDEWGHMMSSAAKLKQCQNDQERTIWNRWPQHVQHSLFHGSDEAVAKSRDLPYNEQMEVANNFRRQGNAMFKELKHLDACHSYEKAYAIFHYVTCSEPEYKTKGIKDRWLTLHDFPSVNDSTKDEAKEETQEIVDFLVACMLNLTACYLKRGEWDLAIQCSTRVLEVEPKNVKAFYRRAEARIGPKEHGQYEEDCAIQDLKKAVAFSEPGSAQFRACGSMLSKLTNSLKAQRQKDKQQFSGFFERGSISSKDKGADAVEQGKMQLEQRIRDAEALIEVYRKSGQHDEAESLKTNVKEARRAMKKGTGGYAPVDYAQPSPQMIQEAKQFGLDLSDMRVVQELQRMEQARKEGKDVEQMLKQEQQQVQQQVQQSKRKGECVLHKPASPEDKSSALSFTKVFLVSFTVLMSYRLLDMGVVSAMLPSTRPFLPERFNKPVHPAFAALLGIESGQQVGHEGIEIPSTGDWNDHDYPEEL